MEKDDRFSAAEALEKLKTEEGLHMRPDTIWAVARKTFLSAISYTDKENKPIIERIEALEKAMNEVKTRGFRYRGTYQRAVDDYRRGDVVTHSGSAWICLESAKGAPGDDSRTWQLMVKGGH